MRFFSFAIGNISPYAFRHNIAELASQLLAKASASYVILNHNPEAHTLWNVYGGHIGHLDKSLILHLQKRS